MEFHEAQIALARQLIGDCPTDQTEITLALPEVKVQTLSASNNSNKNGTKTSSVTMPIAPSADEARQTVEKFERAAREVRSDHEVSDSVAQHMLSDRTTLYDEKWLGTEEEELKSCVFLVASIVASIEIEGLLCRYVSEQLYIHCKLMIVDDTRVIVSPKIRFLLVFFSPSTCLHLDGVREYQRS